MADIRGGLAVTRLWALRLAAYMLVVVMGTVGLWQVEHNQNAIARETRTRNDEQCVTGWTTREDIRDAVEQATTAGAEALIAIAGDAPPERVDAYRAAVAQQAQAARDEIPNPDCDLLAAKRRLGQ